MNNFSGNKEDVVEFVNAKLWSLKPDSQLTMTITQEKSGVCSAQTATEELSEGTEKNLAWPYLETPPNT